jgi:PPOX class probable F420-dependent enzyme
MLGRFRVRRKGDYGVAVTVELSKDLLELLARPSICYLSTLMPDGSPHLTQTWVDTDGTHVLINTVAGHQKVRNIARDPRVAVSVSDREEPRRYFQVRGRVVDVTTDGAAEHIDKLSMRYRGQPYPWFGGRDEVRVLLTIEANRITHPR